MVGGYGVRDFTKRSPTTRNRSSKPWREIHISARSPYDASRGAPPPTPGFCGTEGGRGLRPLKAFDKFFGRPVPDNEDPPIPLGDAILLIQRCGYGNKSIVLEWSWSCCDCSLLQDSALQVDLEVNMPLKQNCISLLHAFRALMPGVFTWALSDAYPLFFDDILQHHSHRALVDAIKTANMMLKYLSLVDSHVAHGLHEAVANAIRSASSKGIY